MKRVIAALCLLFCLAAVSAAAESLRDVVPASTLVPPEDQVELVYSRVIDVPGVGAWPYYAQNDPLWAASLYEPYKSDRMRTMREGGCGPTAAAIAISRHVAPEALNSLIERKNPYYEAFSYCACSINSYRCNRTHERSQLVTGEDFAARLPVALASYACGNNDTYTKYRTQSDGTSLAVFKAYADAYGLDYIGTREWDAAMDALQRGYSIITTVNEGLFTNRSHYLVLAHVDEEWVYVLDPFMRETYEEFDPKGRLEVVEPGLVRARLENLKYMGFSGFYMFGPAASGE